MAGVIHGMDTAAGLLAAATVADGASSIEALASRLDAAIHGFDWEGSDAVRVRVQWATVVRPTLTGVGEHLSDLAISLRREVEQQENTSNDVGGIVGGATGLPAAPDPGLLGRIRDFVSDRLEAGGVALGRLLGHSRDLGEKILDTVTGQRDWSLAAIVGSAITAAGGAVGAGVNLVTGEDHGWFAEGPGQAGAPIPVPLTDTGLGERVALAQPTSIDTIMQSVTDAYANGTVEGSTGEVRIVQVDNGSGTPAYIVAVPGTETWTPSSGAMPRDLTANLQLITGNPTAAAESVQLAMAAAGIPPNAPVMLVGHSQGGMITGHLAADPGFRETYNVTNMITFGAPVDHLDIDGVNVLQMGHGADVVPRLDLGGLGGGGDGPGSTQITLPNPAGTFDVVGNHSHEAYIRSVHDALAGDSAAGDQIRAYQNDPSMAPFLIGPGGQASAVDVPVGRTATNTSP